MKKEVKYPVTELNEFDRKVLGKYTKFFSNFIESNTAKTQIATDERYKGKE